MAEMLSRFLKDVASMIRVVPSLEGLLRLIGSIPAPELILVDLCLIDSGPERTITNGPALRAAAPGSVIIALSGVVDTKDRDRVVAAGFDDLFLKTDLMPIEGTGKAFFQTFGDAITALIRTPMRYQANIRVLELLVEKLKK